MKMPTEHTGMVHDDRIRASLARGRVVARSPGRIRLELATLYRAPAVKRDIERALVHYPGVLAVHASPLTGRLLLLVTPARELALLAELGIDDAAVASSGQTSAASQAALAAQAPAHASAALARTHANASGAPAYPPWHLRESGQAIAHLRSSGQSGLHERDAAARLRRYGHNVIAPPAPLTSLDILLAQFKSLPVALLGLSAIVCAITGGAAEAAALVAVLMLNGAIGFFTERRAETTIASLSELVDDIVPVLRDATVRQIAVTQVVPGDVLMLAPGIRVAADARLLRGDALSMDESALTGESAPAPKASAALARPVPLAERANMAYRGTTVASGTGMGLVVGTGAHTEVGMVEALTLAAKRPRTPIQRQLDQLGNQLVVVSAVLCLGVYALGLLRGYPWLRLLKVSVSLAIGALPEGLPTVATTALARGIRRMRDHKVLIRRLHALETLGAIQTLCMDKTGTLTMNSMSVAAMRSAHIDLQLRPGRGDALPPAPAGMGQAELSRLLQVGVLCNLSGKDEHDAIDSSPTELALIAFARDAGIAPEGLRRRYRLLASELRAEGRNYMRTVHALDGGRRRLVAVKGDPAQVLALCQRRLVGASARELDEAARQDIVRQNARMAERQLRVLGFAYTELRSHEPVESAALTWIGLLGLADPLRPGIDQLIKQLHGAGIRTVMLTGDQALTAREIGKSLHLNHGAPLSVINSDDLDSFAPARLGKLIGHAHIFARVSPAHKLRIVRALQAGGQVVAMTGDGINDAPALRAANIGIAMGGGTDVALSVADIVLKDDQLETLLTALREGRIISSNIRKSLRFLLSSNLSEILMVLGAVGVGSGPPLTPMQLLWLNLLSDMLPAIALAAEPAENDVMVQAPRPPGQALVGHADLRRYGREGAVLAAGGLAAHLYGILRYGPGARAGTIGFNTLVLGQLLHTLSCRSERQRIFSEHAPPPNRSLSAAIGASVCLQILANLVPGLRRLLGIAPPTASDVLATVAGASLPLLFNELAKPGDRQTTVPRTMGNS
ncbi:MAG: cation-transporting P-type ATPase [Pseudomonadota bacterium]